MRLRFVSSAAGAAAVAAAATLLASVDPRPGLKVVATIFPLGEFAREVGGDRTETEILVPPGADIHSWQPRLGDIKTLAGERGLFLYLGSGLDPWAEDLFRNAAGPGWKRLEASRGLRLIQETDHEEGEGHATDPHVWLDFDQDRAIVDRVAAALAELSPSEAPIFEANARAYKARLEDLDRRYAEALRSCRGRRLVVGGHAAFAYLARRYGLVQTAVMGPTPEASPAPRDIVRIIALAKSENIAAVFHEPGSGDRLARTIAREIGAEVLLLHPGHNLTEARGGRTTFIDLMERNLENLRHGLGCR